MGLAVLLVLGTALVLGGSPPTPTTPNLGLSLPQQGQPGWGTLYNQNFSALDSYLGGTTPLPGPLQLGSYLQYGLIHFTDLPTAGGGRVYFCTDCQQTIPCSFGGSGAVAQSINGTWQCISPAAAGGITLPFKFSNDYVWQTAPTSPSSITQGTLTTLNLSICPKGVFGTWPGDVSFYHDPRWDYIYLTAGTLGVAEPTRILGGTCNGDGNPGTLQVITANFHGTGYQVGTATAGAQEASYAAQVPIVSGNNFSYNNNGGTVIVEPGIHKIQAPITVLANSQRWIFMGGAFIECDLTVDTDCFNAGDPGHFQTQNQLIIDRPGFIPGFPLGTRAAIAVFGNQTFVDKMVTFTGSVANASFGHGITVVADQHFNMYGMQFDALQSNSAFVGSKVYAPGPFSGHAGTPYGGALTGATVTSSGSGYVVNDVVSVSQTNGHDGLFQVTSTSPLTLKLLAGGAGYSGASGLTLNAVTGTGSGGVVNITAAGGDNAAVGNIVGLESGNCNGNGVDWLSGNVLHIQDSVIQGFAQFGVRFSMQSGGFGSLQMDNVYNEATCPNPVNASLGTAGLITIGGRAFLRGGEFPSGTSPLFANQSGGTGNSYYIIATNNGTNFSNALYAGSAILNGTGSVNVVFNAIPGATSYDLLASTTLYQGPFGTGNWAVATGQLASSICTSGVCTITDTQAARTSYTVPTVTYAPAIPLWSGGIVASNAAIVSSPSSTTQITLDINDFNFIAVNQTNTAGSTTPVLTSTRCILAAGSPIWQSCLGNEQDLAATMLHVSLTPTTNLKGRLNFSGYQVTPTHIITLVDCNPQKTFASAFNRPANDTCDSYISADQGSGGATTFGIAIGAPVSVSNYINNVGDGTNWGERLTASLKTFKVPVVQQSVTFSALPGSPVNGERVYCSDCTVTTPGSCTNITTAAACTCSSGGTGAEAKRINGAWLCN